MEIEINDTADTKDDVVLLKCDRAPYRPTVNCRIRATGSCAQSSTVVLTNPDRRLRFPGAGDTTTTVTVPQDGSWTSFQISGEVRSNAIGDAMIEAHCATATGAKTASKGVTVVWFDQAQITLTPGANYAVNGNQYTANGVAASFSAKARIRPPGVDCSVPQITNLRVGIMQNVPAAVTHRITWGNPTIAWAAATPSGSVVSVPSQFQFTMANPALANDSAAAVDPMYDQPGKGNTTLDPNSLKPPNGCTGGGTATSNDTPSVQGPATINFPAQIGGTQVGVVTYRRTRMQVDMDFTTWAAIFNTSDNHFCVLRQATWACHVDSAARGQHATASGDAEATTTPVTGGPFFNDNINNAANQATGPLGAAMTNLRKP